MEVISSAIEINLKGKKSSDNHLGAPNHEESLIREKRFVDWLEKIKSDAKVIFLLGDLFDFWFEYKEVVPKGFIRVLGKLAELTDSGIKIYFFVGNHDLWMNGYFQKELNIPVFHRPQIYYFWKKINWSWREEWEFLRMKKYLLIHCVNFYLNSP